MDSVELFKRLDNFLGNRDRLSVNGLYVERYNVKGGKGLIVSKGNAQYFLECVDGEVVCMVGLPFRSKSNLCGACRVLYEVLFELIG